MSQPLWYSQPETGLKRQAPLHSHTIRANLCSEGKGFPVLAQRKDNCTGGPRDPLALSSTSTASAVTAESPEQGPLGLRLLAAEPCWAGVVIAAERLQPQGPLRDKRLKSHLLLYALSFCQRKETTGLHINTVPLKRGREHFMHRHIAFTNDVTETQWVPSCTNRRKSWGLHSQKTEDNILSLLDVNGGPGWPENGSPARRKKSHCEMPLSSVTGREQEHSADFHQYLKN